MITRHKQESSDLCGHEFPSCQRGGATPLHLRLFLKHLAPPLLCLTFTALPWLAFAILPCLALLLFTLALRLSLPYLTPAAQYDSVPIIMHVLFGPVRELWKKHNFLFTIRPDSTDSTDSADSIFGYRFDSDFIGYSLFVRSVKSGSRFDYNRLQLIIHYLF